MDFDFSAEQKALREAVRDTLAREADHDRVRRMMDPETAVADEFWSTISELGWPGLLIGEKHGGLGLGMVDMIVLMEEMGRRPLPGPFFSSAVFATLAAQRLGADDLLADLASGAKRGTVALDEVGSRDPFDGVVTTAQEVGGGWRLNGLKPVVLDGAGADWIIVVARTEDGLGAFLVEDHDAQRVPGLDPTRAIARLELSDTPARRLGGDGDAEQVLRRVADDSAVALCGELLGASDRALDLAVEYSRQREQFGRPIGSFQAMQHMAAEMLQQVELARVGVHYAAWTSDEDEPDREQSAALAKAWLSEVAIAVTGDCHQIHGGVGFTWDVDVHLLFKRAKVNDLLLGQQGWQRQRVADAVLGPVGAAAPA